MSRIIHALKTAYIVLDSIAVLLIAYIPQAFSPPQVQARISLFLSKRYLKKTMQLANIQVLYENPPKALFKKKCILAPIHTTHWEACLLSNYFNPFTFMKMFLLFYPLLGAGALAAMPGIFINRKHKASIKTALKPTDKALQKNHILIFPSAHSEPFEHPTKSLSFIYFLAKKHPDTPIIPIIHTSHFFVTRKGFMPHNSGTLILAACDPIYYDPSEQGRAFLARLDHIFAEKKKAVLKQHKELNS